MSRVHDRLPAFAVGEAMDFIPERLHEKIACEILVGVDPVFAGMHEFEPFEHDGGLLSYKDCAHVIYPDLQLHRPAAFRNVKMFLPSNPTYEWDTYTGVYTVIHELGHVLDFNLDFEYDVATTTEYSEANREEAFAEAFAGWIFGDVVLDEYTRTLFEGL